MTNQLISKEENKRLAENFKRLDKNGDGKLSFEELLSKLPNVCNVYIYVTEK